MQGQGSTGMSQIPQVRASWLLIISWVGHDTLCRSFDASIIIYFCSQFLIYFGCLSLHPCPTRFPIRPLRNQDQKCSIDISSSSSSQLATSPNFPSLRCSSPTILIKSTFSKVSSPSMIPSRRKSVSFKILLRRQWQALMTYTILNVNWGNKNLVRQMVAQVSGPSYHMDWGELMKITRTSWWSRNSSRWRRMKRSGGSGELSLVDCSPVSLQFGGWPID